MLATEETCQPPAYGPVQADRKRHSPRNYPECQNLRGRGSPCDRRYSEMFEDRSPTPQTNPPKHHRRNGLTCKRAATKGCVHSASKQTPERNCRRIARRSNPLPEVMPDLDCSDGPTPVQKGFPRLPG